MMIETGQARAENAEASADERQAQQQVTLA